MSKRIIEQFFDDMTGMEIEEANSVSVKFMISIGDAEYSGEWDVAPYSADSLSALFAANDLAAFITRMRVIVKTPTTSADSDKVREWARRVHPEWNVKERGKMGSEVWQAYKREVIDAKAAPAETAPAETAPAE